MLHNGAPWQLVGGGDILKVSTRHALKTPCARVHLLDVRTVRSGDICLHSTDCYVDYAMTRRPVRSGAVHMRAEGPVPLDFGEIMLVPAGQTFTTRVIPSNSSSLACVFGQDLAIAPAAMDRIAENGFLIQGGWTRDIMLRLANEMLYPRFGSSLMIETLCLQMSVEMQRYLAEPSTTDRQSGARLSPAQVRRIEEWAETGGIDTTLYDLADDLGISRRHLARLFRATTGETLTGYLASRQISRAKAMLMARVPIKAVAWKCGFLSTRAFSAAFRRSVGVTPRKFRELYAAH